MNLPDGINPRNYKMPDGTKLIDMKKSPEQVLAEGVAAKENSTKDSDKTAQRIEIKDNKFRVVGPDLFQDVVDFHTKFGIQYDGPPRELPPDIGPFREARFFEELSEIRDAVTNRQFAEVLDGYVDLIYIILGTCHLHGWDFNEAWRRVHEANMKKELASEQNPGKYVGTPGHKTDIVKPPGWTPPSMQDLVTIPPESLYRPETNLPDTKITS